MAAEPVLVSGVYPHLAMFNAEGECGTRAVVPWAGRLWIVTYAPHKPTGSTDKLYEITPDLRQFVRPESIGGTPANLMIHAESQQLFIGPHAIDERGTVRTIPYTAMFGRHAGTARHLADPAGKIYFATMEEGVYEVDVKTVVRRNQFTEVTGPGGIRGNANPATDLLWSIGWDHRSLILMCLDGGRWHAFRLPKASHAYDGAHGWNTEWPRVRDVGPEGAPDLLMTMHGMFWRFPCSFTATHTAGIRPRSAYLKVVGDFCRWQDRLVLGCDDTAKSEFLNKRKAKGTPRPRRSTSAPTTSRLRPGSAAAPRRPS